MLTDAEISLLLRLDPEPRDLLVLDWRVPSWPSLHAILVRAWAQTGFVACTLYEGNVPSAATLAEELNGTGPVVLTASAPLPDELIDILSSLSGTLTVQERDGRLYRGSRLLDDLDPSDTHTGHTSVVVQGKNSVARHDVDLPQVFRVRPCVVASRSIIRVQGSNPYENMPAPRWFRISGQGSVEVRVNIRANRDTDRWEVTANGQSADPVGSPARAGQRPLFQLGLVFDRTCPDRDAWSDARLLVKNPSDYRQNDQELWPEFNRSIRDGLIHGFHDLPESRSLQVHLTWFADGHEHGVASIEGLEMPWTLTGDLGTHAADELSDLLGRCTYSPGLDLWDPLEEGLRIVAEPFLKRPGPGTGILIVGNSPPNLPLDGISPFYDILEFQGFCTTTRRRNSMFTNLVRDIDAQGIPLVYLFLTHDRCGSAEVAAVNALHVHKNLQGQVCQALCHYMKVVTAPADVEGVTRGLREALEFLATPPPSGVVVSSGEQP